MNREPDKLKMTEDEFEKQFSEATRRGKEDLKNSTRAISAKYDDKTRRLIVELQNGICFMIPTDLIQGLRGAAEDDLKKVELWLEGLYLHWEKLDVDFQVSSLMQGIFGTKNWMKEISAQNINKKQKNGKKVA